MAVPFFTDPRYGSRVPPDVSVIAFDDAPWFDRPCAPAGISTQTPAGDRHPVTSAIEGDVHV
ncbi:MAG: hypothetical protein QOC67_1873 [Pseudonocardiales bacterium]|nr:hypothetical protein [Pseudonocardiales bacterium]MDT7772949.1 hypothetical protein [Pseudonocardiales bacterium]